jgi:hypothetical protein
MIQISGTGRWDNSVFCTIPLDLYSCVYTSTVISKLPSTTCRSNATRVLYPVKFWEVEQINLFRVFHISCVNVVKSQAVWRIRDTLSRIRIRPLLHPGSGSRIRGVKKHRIPDPTYFCIKAINKFYLLIPDPDPTIAPSWIPVRGE